MKRIFPKDDGTGNFYQQDYTKGWDILPDRNSELSACPIGLPVVLPDRLTVNEFNELVKGVAPDNADAYVKGKGALQDEDYFVFPVQFYKIRLIF